MTLKRHSRYSLLDFRGELVQNIMGFEEYDEPPTFRVYKPVEILLQSTFHNILIQKEIVKYNIAKRKKN